MFSPLLAAGWEEFIKILPFVIAILAWVINHFAGQAAKQPQRGGAQPKPAGAPKPKPAADPLQSEIDEFLRQAQALREGKAAPRGAAPKAADQRRDEEPRPAPMGDSRRESTPRRHVAKPPRRTSRREEQRQPAPTSAPVVVEVVEARAARESVAQHVAQSLDSSKFDQRVSQLSQMQRESDAEFQQHMQRVFQHNVGTLEADEASQSTKSVAAEVAATAPVAKSSSTRNAAADVALLLAGRKSIRNAVVLSEILQRPERRW